MITPFSKNHRYSAVAVAVCSSVLFLTSPKILCWVEWKCNLCYVSCLSWKSLLSTNITTKHNITENIIHKICYRTLKQCKLYAPWKRKFTINKTDVENVIFLTFVCYSFHNYIMVFIMLCIILHKLRVYVVSIKSSHFIKYSGRLTNKGCVNNLLH